VISFDRYGVGASDENTTERSPTVDECVRDMFFVMNALLPQQDKFILLGPSMGAIVAQCFIAQHPEKVAGFMNMDGFPAAFENKRDKFLSASGVWNLVGYVAYTGLMRFMLKFMPFDAFATATFSPDFMRYQVWFVNELITRDLTDSLYCQPIAIDEQAPVLFQHQVGVPFDAGPLLVCHQGLG